MDTLRQLAACLGLPDSFSVLHDFFGHYVGPWGPFTAPAVRLSLRTRMRRLSFRQFDVNVIRVGADQMTDVDFAGIDVGINRTRDIYAAIGLTIARVRHWNIAAETADGFEDIGGSDEADDLTDDFAAPGGGLDVFFVLTVAAGVLGYSPVGGSCDRSSKNMNGCVVDVTKATSRVVAHEIGHYLGLEHTSTTGRLMFNSTSGAGDGLTSGEGTTMRSHCMVRAGC